MLAADLRAMDTAQTFWAQVAGFGRAAIVHSETGQRVDGSNWKTVLAYYHGTQIMPIELEDTTFLEMRDTGNLTLIRDEALRNRIAEYYGITSVGSIRANILRHDPEYRRQIRGLTPWPVQEYIWATCYRQLGGTRQELIDCPAPISDEAAAAVLATYLHTDSQLPNLRYWVSTLRVSEIVVTDARKNVDGLARDIQAARGR